jgi:hypothetical protein
MISMSAPSYDTSGLRFSFSVLLTLIAVLSASVIVFNWQVRRWTSNRGWRALLDWARATGFKLSHHDREPPPPFTQLTSGRMTTCLQSGPTKLLQLETLAGSAVQTPRWHVLVRELEYVWPVTALRPAQATSSVIDHFSLSSFPRMGEIERFMVFGTEATAARRLSKSEARALLPQDIGLLLHGRQLVLDFSSRPFDPIEFGRMTAVAEQLVTHLPAPR